MSGVKVKRNVEDISIDICVNVSLIKRLADNIFSNINKYANLEKGIVVDYFIKSKFLVVKIKNYKNKVVKKESSNIGLNNCKAIMKKHNGSFDVYEDNNIFETIIKFPISHDKSI